MLRRNRKGLKRIGLLAFALVMALGAMGVGYAAWTDTVYIEGTVNTGSVDVDITAVSSTFVYKVPGLGYDEEYGWDIEVHYVDNDFDPEPPTEEGTQLIASAVTENTTENDIDEATMTFSGLFPCIDFQANLELTYRGTVPGKISVAIISPDDPNDTVLTELWDLGKYGDAAKGYDPQEYGAWIDGKLTTNGQDWVDIEDPLGLQLHRNDVVRVTLHVHIPQDEAYEGLTDLDFTGLVTVIQWNEYQEP